MGYTFRSDLRPQPWPRQLFSVVRDWLNVPGLDPVACRAILEKALRDGMPDGYVDPAEVTRGGVVGTEQLLRGAALDKPWIWTMATANGPRSVNVPVEFVPSLYELSRIAAHARSKGELLEVASEYLEDDADLRLISDALSVSSSDGHWPSIERPGMYRREHASLILKSRGGTTLVTDPKRSSIDWVTRFGAFPLESSWIEAHVLVTHSHDDHFHLPSIASFAGAGEAVVVPHVPTHTLLAQDMDAILRMVGQPAQSPRWWEKINVGDIEVEILPFYGEQPTREVAVDNGLRNWGNCYRFNIDGMSIVILADSGFDPLGNVVEMLEESCERSGPVDIVMSCGHPFIEMLNPGLPHYSFTLPFELMRQHRASLSIITSGPSGLACACKAAGARYFLPYAHGFNGLFTTPSSEEDSHTEDHAVAKLREELVRIDCQTRVVEWHPGDAAFWTGRDLNIVRT